MDQPWPEPIEPRLRASMPAHPYQGRIDLCNAALESVRGRIPDGLYKDVHEDINRFDEWGLGMETLVDQLTELDIKITLDQFLSIERAMASMALADDHRMRYLRQHGVMTKRPQVGWRATNCPRSVARAAPRRVNRVY